MEVRTRDNFDVVELVSMMIPFGPVPLYLETVVIVVVVFLRNNFQKIEVFK